MITNAIDLDLLIAFIVGFSGLLFVAFLDRSLNRRRSQVANVWYMMRNHAGRRNSRLHRFGTVNRNTRNVPFAGLIIEPEIEIRQPGFFSRRRVVSDGLGRVVATHYEELVLVDFDHNAQTGLMLT